jgi:membrane protein implicated in regulation of membrane protease activity
MEDWVYWIVGAGLLAVGEMFTLSFFAGPVAVAAVVAAIAALAGVGVALQILVFIIASGASLLLLRPIARRHLHTPGQLRTGTAALVGEPGVVVTTVDRDGGQVKLAGEVWTARAFDDDEVIEPGTRVQVIKIEGATALVAE